MGHAGHIHDLWKRQTHDGLVRCVLCSGAGPHRQTDWCPAAECIVCDECCDALLDGDANRLVAIAANVGRIVTPDALLNECATCERLGRHAAEVLFPDELRPDTPLS